MAELQNECSRLFKISPDETLKIVQELYEKKLVTYPRTDARVLSTAVAKEIHKNIGGMGQLAVRKEPDHPPHFPGSLPPHLHQIFLFPPVQQKMPLLSRAPR